MKLLFRNEKIFVVRKILGGDVAESSPSKGVGHVAGSARDLSSVPV